MSEKVKILRIDVWATDGKRVVWANCNRRAGTDLQSCIDETLSAVAERHGVGDWRLLSLEELRANWHGLDGKSWAGVWATIEMADEDHLLLVDGPLVGGIEEELRATEATT